MIDMIKSSLEHAGDRAKAKSTIIRIFVNKYITNRRAQNQQNLTFDLGSQEYGMVLSLEVPASTGTREVLPAVTVTRPTSSSKTRPSSPASLTRNNDERSPRAQLSL